MRNILLYFLIAFLLSSNAFAAPPPPSAFGALPGIYDAAISPDGKQLGIIKNFEGQYGILIISIGEGGQEPRLVTLGEGVKPNNIKWANNNRVLVSFWQSEKYSSTPITTGYLYTLDTSSMKGKILIKPPRGVLRQYNNVVIDYLENDPDHILMSFSEDDNNEMPGIKIVNVANGRFKNVSRGLPGVQYWYTDLRGEPRVGQGLRDRSTEQWVLRIREANGKKWQSADEFPNLPASVDIYGFTSDPNEMIIGSYQGRDTVGLYVYDLEHKAVSRKLFHNDDYDASGVVLSQDGSEVVGASFVADTAEIELFDDYASGLDRIRQRFPDYTVDYIDQSQDGNLVLVKLSNPYDPGAVFLYNFQEDRLSNAGAMYPELTPADLGEVVGVRYTARDGAKIPAYVTLPPSIDDTSQLRDLPFIILPHGGPYARDEKRFDYLAQFFATRGFGVLQMNFRGSAGYGKEFEDSGRENWVTMQDDVEDGARWLVSKGYADPNRMCIAGWSYGGYAALMGALKTPDLYQCAISMAGVTDLQDMIRDIKQYRFGRISAQNFILRGFESKDDIKANSPVKLASELNVPLLLAHGTSDQRVHYDQFRRMKSALKRSPAQVTYLTFKDEDHFLSNQQNRIEFFEAIDKFLLETVGPSEFAN